MARAILERIGLVLVSVCLLVPLEGGLRLMGFGSDAYGALDFGIPSNDTLFAEDPATPGVMVVAPWVIDMERGAHRPLLNRDTFPRRRPAGEMRIVAVGESAVFGYPDGGPMAFPYQLGELVTQRHPGVAVDVINAGVPGYDARRVVKVVQEVLAFEPTVVILYTGHNEYLRRFTMENLRQLGWRVRLRQQLYRLRTYQLLKDVLRPVTGNAFRGTIDVSSQTREMEKREGFGRPRTPFETQVVVQRYRNGIQQAIDACRVARVPLVLCTVVSNVKAYPKHTVYDADVSPENMAHAERLRWEIRGLLSAGDHAGMEAVSRKALGLAPGHAQFHHMLAQALEAQGRLPEALEEFIQARELEATQRRGGSAFNAAIRELGRDGGATVVDLERLFLADMEHGHWGETLFSDYCHPTAEGHAIIAEAIYGAVPWASLSR